MLKTLFFLFCLSSCIETYERRVTGRDSHEIGWGLGIGSGVAVDDEVAAAPGGHGSVDAGVRAHARLLLVLRMRQQLVLGVEAAVIRIDARVDVFGGCTVDVLVLWRECRHRIWH